MDCCFNKNIPTSTDTKFIFKPISKTWINGLANTYGSIEDHSILTNIIDKRTLNIILSRINDDLLTYWPCPTCFCFGYLCSICTLGLSFLCPYFCISEAATTMNKNISLLNDKYLTSKGLNLSYHKICCSSYLQIEIVDQNKAVTLQNENKEDENRVMNNQA